MGAPMSIAFTPPDGPPFTHDAIGPDPVAYLRAMERAGSWVVAPITATAGTIATHSGTVTYRIEDE